LQQIIHYFVRNFPLLSMYIQITHLSPSVKLVTFIFLCHFITLLWFLPSPSLYFLVVEHPNRFFMTVTFLVLRYL